MSRDWCMSRDWGGVVRKQNVESALQIAAGIDSGSARGYAIQEEAYLAALEIRVAGINYQAAVCAVGGYGGGWAGLVPVSNSGNQYRVSRHLRNSLYEYEAGYEHHRLRVFRRGSRGWSAGRNGCWGGRRRWKSGECKSEVSFYTGYFAGLAGLVRVYLIRRYTFE